MALATFGSSGFLAGAFDKSGSWGKRGRPRRLNPGASISAAKHSTRARHGCPEQRSPSAYSPGGHETVNHSKGEYVRGDASTNEVEAYFALLKRGIMGSFHHVSDRHLHRYCDEFSFRWDHRETTDAERTVEAIKGAEGKRLMYRVPIGK